MSLQEGRVASMQGFEWNDELLVGIDLIDQQHREYFARVNQLLAACQAGDAERIQDTFNFLRDYVVFHFDAEQQVMQYHAYPDMEAHVEQHEYFGLECDGLGAEIADKPENPELGDLASNLLVDWFVNHIRQVDRRLGKYLIPRL